MNIAILGAGNVGGALGVAWAQKGHSITFGVRNADDAKVQKLLSSAGANAKAAAVDLATTQAAVVVLATPWEAVQNVLASAGSLTNKVLIDATNPLIMSPTGLQEGLVVGHTTSGAEQIQQWAAGARVVKALNTIGASNMANPAFGGQKATMFICGDDGDAKSTVAKLTDELGFETMDVGMLQVARLLEPVAMLWIHMCVGLGRGPDFGFKVIAR